MRGLLTVNFTRDRAVDIAPSFIEDAFYGNMFSLERNSCKVDSLVNFELWWLEEIRVYKKFECPGCFVKKVVGPVLGP